MRARASSAARPSTSTRRCSGSPPERRSARGCGVAVAAARGARRERRATYTRAMDPSLEHLIAHAERLLTRLEAVLPHAPRAPDWDASVAYRYRRRGGNA